MHLFKTFFFLRIFLPIFRPRSRWEACSSTLEVEGSGLAVEALDLSDSIEAVAERQLVEHADAQGRVDAETWDCMVHIRRNNTMPPKNKSIHINRLCQIIEKSFLLRVVSYGT